MLPLLGLLLLPYTTLFYVLAYAPIVGVSAIGWFFVALGFLLDLASLFGGGQRGVGATCPERRAVQSTARARRRGRPAPITRRVPDAR